MPQNNDAGNAGDDTGAETKTGGKGDNGNADDKPENKSDKADDAKADDKAGQIVFNSQKELDDMIARRINRAIKKADDDAKLTKEQLLEKERDEAKAQVLERDIRDDFVEATGLPIGPGRRIFRMYRDDIETDDKGKATNLKDVVANAKKEFPDLFKAGGGGGERKGKGDGGAGSDQKIGGDMNSALRKMAGR